MSLKVLITGATGFLGSHLVKSLLEQGHSVAILKRSFSNTWRLENTLAQVVAYNIDQCHLSKPFEELGHIDLVIHTATCYGRNHEPPTTLVKSNVEFPLELLETAISFKTNTFLNTDTVLSSNLNSYALSKRHFLDWAKQLTQNSKTRLVNVKLEHIFGPGDDDSKFVSSIMKKCMQNVPSIDLTFGEQQRDFIYIDDVITAYSYVLNYLEKLDENFFDVEVGTGQTTSIRKLVETIHQVTGSSSRLNFGVIPYRDNEMMNSQANIKVLNLLGWSPQHSLDSALELMFETESKSQLAGGV